MVRTGALREYYVMKALPINLRRLLVDLSYGYRIVDVFIVVPRSNYDYVHHERRKLLVSSVVDLIPTGLHTSLLLRGSLILLVKDLHLSSQTLKTSNGTPLLVWVRPCSAVLLSRLPTLVEYPRHRLHRRRPLEPLRPLNRPAVRRRPARFVTSIGVAHWLHDRVGHA